MEKRSKKVFEAHAKGRADIYRSQYQKARRNNDEDIMENIEKRIYETDMTLYQKDAVFDYVVGNTSKLDNKVIFQD